VNGSQKLAGFVMDSMRNAFCFLFQHLIDVSKSRIRFAKRTVRHLVTRYAFSEKLPRSPDGSLAPPGGLQAVHNRRQGLVV
jgi:hypothetical protein